MDAKAESRPGPSLRLVPAGPPADPAPVVLQRAFGAARIAFKLDAGRSVLADLYQQGCLKVRLPNVAGPGAEAILINTAGGLTDGDRLSLEAMWQPGTSAALTTQAAERIYRSRRAPAAADTRLKVGSGANALWLPQETILFDGGRLDRRNHVSLSGSARLIACEAVVLGRVAMGEAVHSGHLRDSWVIDHDDRRCFIDRLELEGDLAAQLDRGAVGQGARAFASLIVAGPDASRACANLRPLLAALPIAAACSDLGHVVLARLVAPSGHALRAALTTVLARICGGGLPRVWSF